jgi:hypothetical protein
VCPTDYVTDTGMPELRSLMGVQLGFMGQRGCKVILGCFVGPAGRQTGTSGNQLEKRYLVCRTMERHTPVQHLVPARSPVLLPL